MGRRCPKKNPSIKKTLHQHHDPNLKSCYKYNSNYYSSLSENVKHTTTGTPAEHSPAMAWAKHNDTRVYRPASTLIWWSPQIRARWQHSWWPRQRTASFCLVLVHFIQVFNLFFGNDFTALKPLYCTLFSRDKMSCFQLSAYICMW